MSEEQTTETKGKDERQAEAVRDLLDFLAGEGREDVLAWITPTALHARYTAWAMRTGRTRYTPHEFVRAARQLLPTTMSKGARRYVGWAFRGPSPYPDMEGVTRRISQAALRLHVQRQARG